MFSLPSCSLYISSPCPSLLPHSFPHDALPICADVPGVQHRVTPGRLAARGHVGRAAQVQPVGGRDGAVGDRKSTRLNSSHLGISYAVFCLKKKTETVLNRERCPDETRTSVVNW